MLPLAGWGANPAVDSIATTIGGHPNSICFLFAPVLFCLLVFNRVPGMATCHKTETCHPEGIDVDLPGISARGASRRSEKRHSAMINQMVSSSFRYVSARAMCFPGTQPQRSVARHEFSTFLY